MNIVEERMDTVLKLAPEKTMVETVLNPNYKPGLRTDVEGYKRTDRNELGTNPKDFVGNKKVSITLIPPVALIACAQALTDGGRKYGPYNWRVSKVYFRIYLDAMYRHIMELLDGDTVSHDALVHHLGHIMANCSILLDALTLDNVVDDRPVPGHVKAVLMRVAELANTPDEEKQGYKLEYFDPFVPYIDPRIDNAHR